MPNSLFFTPSNRYTIETLAKHGACTVSTGDDQSKEIHNVAAITDATSHCITFFSNIKYKDQLKDCKAGACIIHSKYQHLLPSHTIALLSDNPYASYAKIAQLFYPLTHAHTGISERATIHKSASVGSQCTIEAGVYIGEHAVIKDHTYIGANTVIGANVRIGSACVIHSNVTISHAVIGDNVTIHTGTRIGQDGFGFATDRGMHISVPQLGGVLIGNNSNIGANCCIDRGAGPDTIIGEGCRLDNLVQIGHNVELGKGCVVVSQVGISGSTKCGDYVVIGGQAGIAGHLTIGALANIAAQSGVINNIEPKQIVGGSPAIPVRQWHRQTIALKRLTSTQGNTNDT